MSTRGIFGFRLNQRDKIIYNHWDSYPSGLGNVMIEQLRELLKNREKFEQQIEAMIAIDEDVPPTKQQIQDCDEYTDLTVSKQNTNDWYCLLKKTQGNPTLCLKAKYYVDAREFIDDGLFCEYGYIANLDKNVLEIYKGNQSKPHQKGRYAKQDCETHFPLALERTISFKRIYNGSIKKITDF